ncbi:hypothetical protein T01_8295 [Trichinella spiralis]|uniref:Uncharacterized protein n=1 Tax=Trichinella spiralis TaxID=6334 RepID=A0A0V1B5G8_TRISP|nr:hypothetical protein T01_8295 [Trichinella spiralis]
MSTVEQQLCSTVVNSSSDDEFEFPTCEVDYFSPPNRIRSRHSVFILDILFLISYIGTLLTNQTGKPITIERQV